MTQVLVGFLFLVFCATSAFGVYLVLMTAITKDTPWRGKILYGYGVAIMILATVLSLYELGKLVLPQ